MKNRDNKIKSLGCHFYGFLLVYSNNWETVLVVRFREKKKRKNLMYIFDERKYFSNAESLMKSVNFIVPQHYNMTAYNHFWMTIHHSN